MTGVASTAHRLPLLSSMAKDLNEQGSLRTSTAAGMWAAYTTHTGLTGWALARRVGPLPIPTGAARVAGAALITTGAGLCVVGMSRFTGAQELTGTRNQTLTTNGVYRYSRNPQYLGYLLALTGAGLVRRSSAALATTASLAAAYTAWIPVEEQHLTGLYRHTYTDYTRRTRRWWGRRA